MWHFKSSTGRHATKNKPIYRCFWAAGLKVLHLLIYSLILLNLNQCKSGLYTSHNNNVCNSLYRFLKFFVFEFFRLAAAQEAAAQAVQQQAGAGAADRMGGVREAGGQGPSSLFLLSDENFIRRYTRFIIEWPYPFLTHSHQPEIRKWSAITQNFPKANMFTNLTLF